MTPPVIGRHCWLLIHSKWTAFMLLFVFIYTFTHLTSNLNSIRPEKPHIIFLLADDLGFNDVPWHDDSIVAPNIKALSEDGIILEQSYVTKICTPTRASFLTGLYPFALGRQRGILQNMMPTGLTLKRRIIPQYLKELGYSTHPIGKWHLGFCNWSYTPTERGFDTFRGIYGGHADFYTHKHGGVYSMELHDFCLGTRSKALLERPPVKELSTPISYDYRDNRMTYYPKEKKYATVEYVDHFKQIMETRDPSIPAFVYMAFQNVHTPRQAPEEYVELYAHIKDRQRRIQLAQVSAMDDAIGRMVDILRETNHYKNSIIIFSSDNGAPIDSGGINWPLRGSKNTLWEGGSRAPGFIHSPLLSKKGRTDEMLMHVTDWLPTMVHLSGGQIPEGIDGVDQWEAILGQAPSQRQEIVYNLDITENGVNAAIRYKEHKMIVGNAGRKDRKPPPEKGRKESEMPLDDSEQNDVEIVTEDSMSDVTVKDLQKLREEIILKDKSGTLYEEETDISNSLLSALQKQSIKIKLFHLEDDPEESNDLSGDKNQLLIIGELIKRLLAHLPRLVPPDCPMPKESGNPKYYNNIWSPGWC